MKSEDKKEQILEKWLICVDPDSQQIYTLNINTNEVQIELDVDIDYRRKAQDAIKNIDEMLRLKNGKLRMSPLLYNSEALG